MGDNEIYNIGNRKYEEGFKRLSEEFKQMKNSYLSKSLEGIKNPDNKVKEKQNI